MLLLVESSTAQFLVVTLLRNFDQISPIDFQDSFVGQPLMCWRRYSGSTCNGFPHSLADVPVNLQQLEKPAPPGPVRREKLPTQHVFTWLIGGIIDQQGFADNVGGRNKGPISTIND